MRRSTLTTCLALVASSLLASASPVSHISSSSRSLLHPRENEGAMPPGTEDIIITGAIINVECVTDARTQNHSMTTIEAVTRFFTNDLVGRIPPTPSPDAQPFYTDFAAQLPQTANAGVDEGNKPTFTLGCDAGKPLYWAPMSGTYENDEDIVVLNLDGGVRRAGFCGVMTRAAVGGEKKYQICNPLRV